MEIAPCHMPHDPFPHLSLQTLTYSLRTLGDKALAEKQQWKEKQLREKLSLALALC